MIVYKSTNVKSGHNYYGITNNLYNRKAAHKSRAKKYFKTKQKTPFYCAINKYGWNNFVWEVIFDGTSEEAASLEIKLISEDKNCYNLHEGGTIGFSMRKKSKEDYEEWKSKLIKARQGRKPALGMSHSNENKKLFSDISRKWWDSQETYSWKDIKDLTFKEANLQFGISKTHYYRLKKRLGNNES